MEPYSLLKKQQWLVLICLLSGFTSSLKYTTSLSSTTILDSQRINSTFESPDSTSLQLEESESIEFKLNKLWMKLKAFKDFFIHTYKQKLQCVLKWDISNILVYDNITQTESTDTVQLFLEVITNSTSASDIIFDWYLPIYRNHGGGKSITKFMALIKLYSDENNSNYILSNETLNFGEFVHIWSEATATDLRYLVYRSVELKWTRSNIIAFEKAQKTLMTYHYQDFFQTSFWTTPPQFWKKHWEGHTSNLTLCNFDGHVAYYCEESVPFSNVTWPLQLVSDSWQYVKKTYGFLPQHNILFIILHAGNKRHCFLPYSNITFDYRFAISCEIDKSKLLEEIHVKGESVIKNLGFIIALNMLKLEILTKPFLESKQLDTILVYDIYNGIGRMDEANKWIEANDWESKYPRKKTLWIRDWYIPLFTKIGQKKALPNVLTFLYVIWAKDYNMNIGEFVHFWSATVSQDLQCLGMESFGWRKKYDDELLQARIDYPQLSYLYTPENSSLPQNWTRNWKNYDNTSNQVYIDKHIVFYISSDTNISISWPFKLMSDSWKYAKKQYGPLSTDPLLYINFHHKTSKCRSSKEGSYFDTYYGNRNVIDCGKELAYNKAWHNSSENKDILIEQVGLLILRNARETGHWPGFASSISSMVAIFVYDIYKGLGMLSDAERWRKLMFAVTEQIPLKKTFWFRDWYYPIYQKYKEAFSLNRFLTVVKIHWPEADQDYIGQFNMGEMVHFWSIAVEENLWPLADKTFGCCAWDQRTYLIARKEYSVLTYSDKIGNSTAIIPSNNWIDVNGDAVKALNLVHVDPHTAVYVDFSVDLRHLLPFRILSEAWRFAKKTYGPFELGAILNVLILRGETTGCFHSGDSAYLKIFGNQTVLACNGLFNAVSSTTFVFRLIEEMGKLVLQEATHTRRWPAESVSNFAMGDIMAYDIFCGIGESFNGIVTLYVAVLQSKDVPIKKTFWTRDWFYPIYMNYGGANVLINFLNLLSTHWPKILQSSRFNYVEQLNVGEFVHFWSGAAGVNLFNLANSTFQWNHDYSVQLNEAIRSYPGITYHDVQEITKPNSREIVLNEETFGPPTLLVKVYEGFEITVYIDSDVNRAVKWPIDLLSKAWSQAKSNYNTLQNTLDSNLNIFLHAKNRIGCRTSLKTPDNVESKNVLDCGKVSMAGDAWAESTAENRLDLINGLTKLILQSANQTEGKEKYDHKPFSQTLAFDIFLRLGNLKDAHGMLKTNYRGNEIESGGGKFWVRDWFLPLYTQYGGVAFFNNYVTLLETTWSQQNTSNLNQKINVGQKIHFWSSSAGTNLNHFAQLIFGRNHLHQKQFSDAQKEFPLLTYFCYNCEPDIDTQNSSESYNVITGVSVGFVCLIITVVVLPLAIYRKKLLRLQVEMRELTAEEIKEFFEGNNETGDTNRQLSIESKPFNVDYEIQREQLDIDNDFTLFDLPSMYEDFDNLLGSGEFGLVYRGKLLPATGLSNELIGTLVAVKTVKPNVNVTHFKTILTELKVMGYLGSHANIVSLLGAYTVNIRNREVYMALEFCNKGDLLSFLKNNQSHFADWIAKRAETTEISTNFETAISIPNLRPETVVAGNSEFGLQIKQDVENATVTTENIELQIINRNEGTNSLVDAFSVFELLKWSSQIASGMEFIASKNVIHGDLAARNVLITEENVAKISDFGLSRQLENYAFYMKTSKTPVPWRWMAIEALRDMKFSVQSDTWSFGVVLYEIFSLGAMPYAGCTWDWDFLNKLVAGHRLSAPEFGNESVYQLMMDCMHQEASERITFPQVISKLNEIKVEICQERKNTTTSEYLQFTS